MIVTTTVDMRKHGKAGAVLDLTDEEGAALLRSGEARHPTLGEINSLGRDRVPVGELMRGGVKFQPPSAGTLNPALMAAKS